ncbi:hypothetical protein BRADI_3g25181v3 [Brachypodium distachyon]|uniref:Malonyl-CoA decarboxylase C-terminal domain-containing protein n=1 Tax=Brachypodium distachyon TaxID=15368 RepID=A0A0Q3FEH7_BRADI|nr:hypothetical protein BRADI_3g25181v3 [Brachypodium distachyon]
MSRPHLLSPDLRPVSISSTRCGLRLPRPPLLRSPRSMDGPRVATIEFPARRRSPRPWTVPSPPSRRRSPAPSRPAVEDQHHRRRLLAACPTSSPPSQLGPGFLAVHRITNLIDLKRRLGIGRRCCWYFHPTIAELE